MRPVLLGSAAMAAIGLVAADAAAADGVQLSIGGRYKGAAGILPTEDFSPSSGTDDDDVRNYVFKQDVEVYFLGETVLGMTRERITTAPGLCGWLEGRSRFARVGLLIHISASFMQPGLDNHQVLEMSNFGHLDLEIEPDTAICQFVFQRTLGGDTPYEGQYKGQTPDNFWRD